MSMTMAAAFKDGDWMTEIGRQDDNNGTTAVYADDAGNDSNG